MGHCQWGVGAARVSFAPKRGSLGLFAGFSPRKPERVQPPGPASLTPITTAPSGRACIWVRGKIGTSGTHVLPVRALELVPSRFPSQPNFSAAGLFLIHILASGAKAPTSFF